MMYTIVILRVEYDPAAVWDCNGQMPPEPLTPKLVGLIVEAAVIAAVEKTAPGIGEVTRLAAPDAVAIVDPDGRTLAGYAIPAEGEAA